MSPGRPALTILLASNSPRRREMLSWLGSPYRARGMDIDESPCPGEAPGRYCLRLAQNKARAARPLAQPGEVILAADTIVADGGDLLGKPADAAEAEAILRRLRGGVHSVFTALALLDPHTGRMVSDLCEAPVHMRRYSDEEMHAYIASGDPFDKAGAYAIQHPGFAPVAQFSACFACVVGLPVCHLQRSLAALHPGLAHNPGIAAVCQAHFNYTCPVHPTILAAPPLHGYSPE